MGNKQTHNTTDSKNVGDTRSSRALEGENREQCREVEDGNSPLNELFLELKLMVLGFLDARSLHAMLFVIHSLHELIHSTGGQNGLWLPLLSQQLHHKDTEQTLRMYPEADNTNWKALFVEALQIPSFDPKGHLYFSLTDSAHTATLAGSGVHSYKCARTIKPILPNSSTYFEGTPTSPRLPLLLTLTIKLRCGKTPEV